MKLKTAPLRSDVRKTELPGFPGTFLLTGRRISGIDSLWDKVIEGQNIFLSSAYLTVLEQAGPENLEYCYTLVYRNNQPVGAIYCQLTSFDACESLNLNRPLVPGTGSRPIRQRLTKEVATRIKFNAIICGNALATGEHAYRFSIDLDKREEAEILAAALEKIRDEIEGKGGRIPVILVKDFYEPNYLNTKTCFLSRAYHQLSVQPNMIMHIPEGWRSISDYSKAIRSKYRIRNRRAEKFAESLVKRELGLEELEIYAERMHFLYKEIALGAEFNLFILSKNYIRQFKQSFPSEYRVFGYFRGNEMVGFFSTVRNQDEIEAHFLGYRQEVNREFQLYHNMLLDIVEQAILSGAKRIVFARTALEIKSSIGAEPEEMHCYIQHKSPFMNALFPWIFNFLNPAYSWEQRHPFPEDE